MKLCITDYSAEKITYHKVHKSVDSLHYEKACIGYLLQGSAEYLCEGMRYSLEEGDLIFIPKNSVCVSMWKSASDIVFFSVNFDYRGGEELEDSVLQVVHGVGEKLLREMVESMEGHYLKSKGLFYLLLDSLLPQLKKDTAESAEMIRPALRYLKEHCTEKFYVSGLAKLCNLSVSNFYVYFRAEVGCTPIEYKNNLLVQKGVDLLLNKGLTVEETAQELGFSSAAYFRKLFKEFTNKLPKEFKQ